MMARNPENEMKNFQQSVAMTVTLISFGMMFASMFLGYFLVRFNAPTWPPVEIEKMPKLLPFLSTVVIALSSFAYYKFEKGTQKKTPWLLTVALGALFLGLQFALWNSLAAAGIFVGNGNVPSMVYAFTWLHALHIVMALGLVLWLGFFVYRRPSGLTDGRLINVGKFWHFLGVVWFLMYLMLFVL
jgi:cytochrome c oxidase subunit 3